MRKTKVEGKFERTFDSFFDKENHDENQALSFAGGTELLTIEADDGFSGKDKLFLNVLKQIFLFLPGTFILYFVGFIGAIIFADIFIIQRPLATLPPSALFQIILLGSLGLLGTFMTWFGLGDIKNRKHLAIPASILLTGAILGVILKALGNVPGLAVKLVEEFNHYFIYLLPLVLIISVLTKSWVDKKAE